MALFKNRKKTLLAFIVALSSQTYANSTHNIYLMTLSILSYVKWSPATPTLCVIEDANATQQLNQSIRPQIDKVKIESINYNEIETNHCDAVLFSQSTPQLEQKLINKSLNRKILSFSRNNTDCEIGSVFCLYASRNGNTLFKVNLDSLAKSRIHIDPRVLLLAKNSE